MSNWWKFVKFVYSIHSRIFSNSVHNHGNYVISSAYNGQAIAVMAHLCSLRPSGAYKEVLWAGISLMDSIDTLSCSECHIWPCRKSRIEGWQGRGSHSSQRTHGHSICLFIYMILTSARRHLHIYIIYIYTDGIVRKLYWTARIYHEVSWFISWGGILLRYLEINIGTVCIITNWSKIVSNIWIRVMFSFKSK